ncbi:hypothetical protein ABZV64_20155 [Streptomyces sp. NPDC004959]|uniref:hypothetical protein n=1 Tax=unclassified Streptomyces TaxID=2593676 RepID=UPI0004CB8906|nr:hypothetical protein [Streptomyces sp. NRRL F-5630]
MSVPTGKVALPAVETLTDEQRRGRACVWCETPLDPGISDIDLGARPATRTARAWFPRACPNCAHVHVGTRGPTP